MQQSQTFSFSFDFQRQLVKLLTLDSRFSQALMPHLKAEFFENEVLRWTVQGLMNHRGRYGQLPSLAVMLEETRRLDPKVQALYRGTVDSIIAAQITDEAWLRENTVEFVRRAIFVRAFEESKQAYNQGDFTGAYDMMQQRMDELNRATIEPIARTFFFEDLPLRQARRSDVGTEEYIPTGFPTLDKILGGGLHIGEVGCWMAYPKVGKSTMLQAHALGAIRGGYKNVLHFVFEGRLEQFTDRYDSAFGNILYTDVKRGDITAETYARIFQEYQLYKSKLVVRDFTDRWDYTIVDVQEEISQLKNDFKWKPELIVIDYGDLLGSRDKGKNGYENQKAAYRDIKSLANRGYGLWTATAATRPDEGDDVKPHLLRARDIAECFDKVRILDFLGTLNQTVQERKNREMRVLPDTARDVPLSGNYFQAIDDRARMTITENGAQADKFHGIGFNAARQAGAA